MLYVSLLLTLVKLSMSTFDPELHAKYQQLPRQQFIQYFNSQNYTWKITEYPQPQNERQGCLLPDDISESGLGMKTHDPKVYLELPDSFDARQNWPQCNTIGSIYNQGHCSSCWAFSTATVASDRTCISKGLNVQLSQQDFDCLQPICNPGRLDQSFPYWKSHGLVTLNCKPYDISDTRECVKECKDTSINYVNDKHFAEDVYTISSSENDIKAELFQNGPISAAMVIYDDFQDHYTSGIYEYKFGEKRSGHAVKIIGYGVENGVDFWLVANSWGSTWGENGLFRIKRYQDEIGIENGLYTGMAKN